MPPLRFRLASASEIARRHRMMAGRAIGDDSKSDLDAMLDPKRGRPRRFDFRVIGMTPMIKTLGIITPFQRPCWRS